MRGLESCRWAVLEGLALHRVSPAPGVASPCLKSSVLSAGGTVGRTGQGMRRARRAPFVLLEQLQLPLHSSSTVPSFRNQHVKNSWIVAIHLLWPVMMLQSEDASRCTEEEGLTSLAQ